MPKKKKSSSRPFFLILIVITLLIFSYFVWFINPYWQFIKDKDLLKVMFYPTTKFLKTENNNLNLILLGVAGEQHDGPNLTDSMLFLSYSFNEKKLITFNIPRDIWSENMKDKINSGYYYGKEKANDALFWLRPELQRMFGLAPDYYLVIDISKLKVLIDYLGGVEVKIENSFTDNKFPIEGKENDLCNGDETYGCRYRKVVFKKGIEKMNGERALQYTRSRYAIGVEGTDYAREKRQQQIFIAMIKKISEPQFILSRNKFINFVKLIDKSFDKNLNLTQITALAKDYLMIHQQFTFKKIVFGENLFTVPAYSDYDGRYVLLPKNGFKAIQKYLKDQSK